MGKTRLTGDRFIALPSVSPYREDVEAIIEILRKAQPEVIVEDGAFRYDTLDDLVVERGPTPRKLTLQIYRPSVSLTFKRGFPAVSLFGGGSNDAAGPFALVKELLLSRRGLIGRLVPWWLPLAGVNR